MIRSVGFCKQPVGRNTFAEHMKRGFAKAGYEFKGNMMDLGFFLQNILHNLKLSLRIFENSKLPMSTLDFHCLDGIF